MSRADAFADWLKRTPMPDFAALNSQILWSVGSLSFTFMACLLLWRDSSASREAGLAVVGMLLTAWTGKSYQNRKSNEVQRTTSREFLQESARADAVRASAAVPGGAGPGPAAGPGLPLGAPIPPDPAPDGLPGPVGPQAGTQAVREAAGDRHRWRTGDPDAGLG